MKYSVRDITMIAFVAVITVVLGYFFYIAGSLLPIPGHKFVVFAPLLGFMIYIPIYTTKKMGVVTVLSIVFAFLMLSFTFFMSIAIVMSGISTDLITYIVFRDYKTTVKMIASAGLYPVAAVFWAFLISSVFTGNVLYTIAGDWKVAGVLSIIIYSLGVIGAVLSNKIIRSRIALLGDESS